MSADRESRKKHPFDWHVRGTTRDRDLVEFVMAKEEYTSMSAAWRSAMVTHAAVVKAQRNGARVIFRYTDPVDGTTRDEVLAESAW